MCSAVEKECDRLRGPLLGEDIGESTTLSLLLLGRRCDFGGVKELENQVSRGLVLVGLN